MDKLKPCEVIILIAEDDDGHAELIREHLEDAGIRNTIRRFKNGRETADFLLASKSDNDIAYLLLLDIRMPGMDGIEILQLIKTDDHLKKIPVIMLTTTDDPREIKKCYELGCNAYITKPVDFSSFADTLRRLGLFLLVMKMPVNNCSSKEK